MKNAKTKTAKKPRANERWLVAVYELPLDLALLVRKTPREAALKEASKLGEVKKQLRAFAREYKRRIKSFTAVKHPDGKRRFIVAVFDSRIPQLGVEKRTYRPNKDRAHAIEVSWVRTKS